jgi:hypothetical protein
VMIEVYIINMRANWDYFLFASNVCVQEKRRRMSRLPLEVERRFSDPVRLESGWENLR